MTPHSHTPLSTVQTICSLSQALLDLAEQESQALITHDFISFSILQDEKTEITKRYVSASHDFRAQLDAMKTIDSVHINRLESLQDALQTRTQDNNALLLQMEPKAADAPDTQATQGHV